MSKKVWNLSDGRLFLEFPAVEQDKLENAVYTVGYHEFLGFYLSKVSDSFTFDYKLYGLESDFIKRVIKTYGATTFGNLGVLLNGLKGTGKTVSSKILANQLQQPVILVGADYKGVETFLNSIPQNITIFVDEYEKIFGNKSSLLTIMDGALNSKHRRVFILTTNELYIETNMLQRPSRIRYLKTFENLAPTIVEEIVNDILEFPAHKTETINFISNLETITVDIVKSVLSEINIHNEGPLTFEKVYNVKKLKGKYNVSLKEEDGTFSELATSVSIYPRPMFNEESVGTNFNVDETYIGKISKVLNWTTIEVSPYDGERGQKLGFTKPITLKVEDANIVNYSFGYDPYGSSIVTKSVKKFSSFAENIKAAIEKDAEDTDEA